MSNALLLSFFLPLRYWVWACFLMPSSVSLLFSGLLSPHQSGLLGSIRFASKKSGGSAKNHGGNSPGRRYGYKKQDGKYFSRFL